MVALFLNGDGLLCILQVPLASCPDIHIVFPVCCDVGCGALHGGERISGFRKGVKFWWR